MLSHEALEAALPLTQRLDGAGVKLVAMPQTALAELVKATRSGPEFFIETNPGEYAADLTNIGFIANTRDAVMDICSHDVALDHIVQVGIDAVRAHLNIARNMVAPAVGELHDAVALQLTTLPPSMLLGMEVRVFDLPIPYKSPALDGMVRKFEEEIADVAALNFNLPDLTVPELVDLMKPGAGGVNNAIDDWVAQKGETFILQMYETLFQIKNERFKTLNDVLVNKELGPDYAVGGFLLARKLLDDPIEGVNMPLGQYEKSMAIVRNQCAAKVCRIYSEWENQAKRGVLVRAAGQNWIEVYENVYRPWLEAGGENEILFGNLLERPLRVTVESINEVAGGLKAAWLRHERTASVVIRNQRNNALRQILKSEFKKQIDSIGDDKLGPDINASGRAIVWTKFQEHLAMIKDREFDRLHDVCLKLVCRSRFYQTDAEDLLARMDALAEEEAGLDPREAATIITIEYVAEWVASQMMPQAALA